MEMHPDAVAEQRVPAPPVATPDPAAYPRMLYHPDGRTAVSATPEQHNQLMAAGWGTAPLAVHQKRPVSHHGVLGTDSPFSRPLLRW